MSLFSQYSANVTNEKAVQVSSSSNVISRPGNHKVVVKQFKMIEDANYPQLLVEVEDVMTKDKLLLRTIAYGDVLDQRGKKTGQKDITPQAISVVFNMLKLVRNNPNLTFEQVQQAVWSKTKAMHKGVERNAEELTEVIGKQVYINTFTRIEKGSDGVVYVKQDFDWKTLFHPETKLSPNEMMLGLTEPVQFEKAKQKSMETIKVKQHLMSDPDVIIKMEEVKKRLGIKTEDKVETPMAQGIETPF